MPASLVSTWFSNLFTTRHVDQDCYSKRQSKLQQCQVFIQTIICFCHTKVSAIVHGSQMCNKFCSPTCESEFFRVELNTTTFVKRAECTKWDKNQHGNSMLILEPFRDPPRTSQGRPWRIPKARCGRILVSGGALVGPGGTIGDP